MGSSPSTCTILVTGLDAAGKSDLLRGLSWGEVMTTVPTIGLSVDQLSVRSNAWVFLKERLPVPTFVAADMIQAEEMCMRWRLLPSVLGVGAAIDGVVFVVDAHDVDRITRSATQAIRTSTVEELLPVLLALQLPTSREREVLTQFVPTTAPVVVLANKQDLPQALSADELSARLNLPAMLNGRSWHVQACSVSNGSGVREGVEWLVRAIAAGAHSPRRPV